MADTMHRAGAGAQLSPYSEWEQAEQQRMSRISRMRPSGNPFDERQPQEEVVLVGPEEGDGGGMEAVGNYGGRSEPQGRGGESPVRASSYGRYLQARKAAAGGSPHRTPSGPAAADGVYTVGGVTPEYAPPDFAQAMRNAEGGGGGGAAAAAAWGEEPAAAPHEGGALAADEPTEASAWVRDIVAAVGDDDDELSDDGSGGLSGSDDGIDGGRARPVAKFSREPEFATRDDDVLNSSHVSDEPPLPPHLDWVSAWIERGEAIDEVPALCGAGSVRAQLEELAQQPVTVLREGLSNLRSQILQLQDPATWPGGEENQTERQLAQRQADQAALEFFVHFTDAVLARAEEGRRKAERERRQRELDGVPSPAADAALSSTGSARGWADGMGGDAGAGAGPAAAQVAGGAAAGGSPQRAGRSGIFVTFEGWLKKKTQSSIAGRKRWQLKWFSIVTKETHGLVDSRTMQYYEEKPPEGRETEVEAAHGILLPVERQIEPYEKTKFRLRVRPADPDTPVYCFRTETAEECQKWMSMLADESNPSPARRGGLGHNHQVFLAEARDWILRVYKKHKPGKLKDVDVLLAEWVGEEEELLQKIVEKYHPKEPAPAPPDSGYAQSGINRLMR